MLIRTGQLEIQVIFVETSPLRTGGFCYRNMPACYLWFFGSCHTWL